MASLGPEQFSGALCPDVTEKPGPALAIKEPDVVPDVLGETVTFWVLLIEFPLSKIPFNVNV